MHSPLQDRSSPPEAYRRGVVPAPVQGQLRGDRRVDVAVIGGGFTGLSAALHLAERGVGVALLEAKEIGWGASGRAFGQVVPYLKHGPDRIITHYGEERGERIIDAAAGGPEFVFGLIERHRIQCNAVRTGLLFAAHSSFGRRTLEERSLYWARRGAPVSMLDASETRAAIGSDVYSAASLDRRGGHLNPFAFAVGLGTAAVKSGAAIFAQSPARNISCQGGRWRIGTEGGALIADTLIIATNAYSEALWPGLRESIIPLRGHAAVSEPLSEGVRRAILPRGHAMTDTRHLFSGIRLLSDGRLHASADGPAFGPERSAFLAKLSARVARLFPFLGAVNWQERWSGWIALTPEQFPRLHELAPAVFSGLGYSGRGIAAACLMGRDLAGLAAGTEHSALTLPVSPLRAIPAHRFAPAFVGALIWWYRLIDTFEWHTRKV